MPYRPRSWHEVPHTTTASFPAFPFQRLLVSIGDVRDKKIFVWDLATGCINASAPMNPCPTNIVGFGGMVKSASRPAAKHGRCCGVCGGSRADVGVAACGTDIKRRATSNYMLCTAGNGQIFLWSLNPITGELASVKVSTSSYTREYTCMQFSADREWLYAGTTTGDFACISVRRRGTAARVLCACTHQ